MSELQAHDFHFAIIGSASIAFINELIRELQALMPRALFWMPLQSIEAR
jgi:DNA-binding GntR family transcriptional regulator